MNVREEDVEMWGGINGSGGSFHTHKIIYNLVTQRIGPKQPSLLGHFVFFT